MPEYLQRIRSTAYGVLCTVCPQGTYSLHPVPVSVLLLCTGQGLWQKELQHDPSTPSDAAKTPHRLPNSFGSQGLPAVVPPLIGPGDAPPTHCYNANPFRPRKLQWGLAGRGKKACLSLLHSAPSAANQTRRAPKINPLRGERKRERESQREFLFLRTALRGEPLSSVSVGCDGPWAAV